MEKIPIVFLLLGRNNCNDSEDDKDQCNDYNKHTAHSAQFLLGSLGNIGVDLCVSNTNSQFKRDPVLKNAHAEFSDLLYKVHVRDALAYCPEAYQVGQP